jgi:glycine hydroxymethyltransferase
LKFFKHASYSLKSSDDGYELDIDDYTNKIKSLKPRLVIIGFSAYPKQYQFKKLCEIAHENGCLVLADIAHIAGLVAAGKHPSPFMDGESGADFVTTTTHKTLRGPRSALLFAKSQYMDAINKTVFPGTSGGPHLNQIAAVGQALLEILDEENYPDSKSFKDYIEAVLENTKALEEGLKSGGAKLVTNSETHLSLIELPGNVDSLDLQQKLEKCGIIANRNSIPNDARTAWRPSGLRLGMPALTSREISIDQAKELGGVIAGAITNRMSEKAITSYVDGVADSLQWWY